MSFGTRDGLWPIASTDRGEILFLVAADSNAPCVLVADGGQTRYDMSFAEWFYRYLIGEDMAGARQPFRGSGPRPHGVQAWAIDRLFS